MGPAGGDEVTGHIAFAPEAKKVLELSVRDALRLGHNYVGTEHILLGVLSLEGGLGPRVLAELGITKARAEEWLVPVLTEMARERAATGTDGDTDTDTDGGTGPGTGHETGGSAAGS
jgi:ATP-dependent Clp protease ATP-binding subunit ClpA